VEKLQSHSLGTRAGFTQLIITAADAERLRTEFVDPPGGVNVPDDRSGARPDVRTDPREFRSSLIIDPDDGKIPWQEMYKENRGAAARGAHRLRQPGATSALERCLGSTAVPPMQPTGDNSMYQIVQTRRLS